MCKVKQSCFTISFNAWVQTESYSVLKRTKIGFIFIMWKVEQYRYKVE